MPKHLPKPLTTTLPHIDGILSRLAESLAQSSDTKVSVADWIRLFQFRLDLADRFDAMNPRPSVALWVEPSWAFETAELPDAISALEMARQKYEEALRQSQIPSPPQDPESPPPSDT